MHYKNVDVWWVLKETYENYDVPDSVTRRGIKHSFQRGKMNNTLFFAMKEFFRQYLVLCPTFFFKFLYRNIYAYSAHHLRYTKASHFAFVILFRLYIIKRRRIYKRVCNSSLPKLISPSVKGLLKSLRRIIPFSPNFLF